MWTGDHYAALDGTTVTATQDLRATLQLQFDSSGADGAEINGVPCNPLCDAPVGFGPPVYAGWDLAADIHLTWQFSDIADNVVQMTTLTSGTPGPGSASDMMTVLVDWNGHWSVPSIGESDPCGFGGERLYRLAEESQRAGQLRLAGSGFGISEKGLQVTDSGCLLHLEETASSQPLATVLYRYGALIAADGEAHSLWPQLPTPSANERTIIATLAAGQH